MYSRALNAFLINPILRDIVKQVFASARWSPGHISPRRVSKAHRKTSKTLSPNSNAILSGGVSKEMSSRNRPAPYPRPKGLDNPHSWCYRRSLLQCLLHTPAFCAFLRGRHLECERRTRNCAFCAIQELARIYWEEPASNAQTKAAYDLDHAINQRLPGHGLDVTFKHRYRQQDPHEFFMGLYNLLLTEVDRQSAVRLERLFQLGSTTHYYCEDCERTQTRTESNTGHHLTLAPNKSSGTAVDTHLRTALTDMELDPTRCNDELGCSGFEDPKARLESFRITQAPEILVVQVVRFGFDPVTGQGTRNADQIEYSGILDMLAYTESSESLRYRLHGVVAHSGRTVHNGHYVAAVRNQENSGISPFSDSDVKKGQADRDSELLNPMNWNKHRGFVPYLLVYQKIGATEEDEEQEEKEGTPGPAKAKVNPRKKPQNDGKSPSVKAKANPSKKPDNNAKPPSAPLSAADTPKWLAAQYMWQQSQLQSSRLDYKLAFAIAKEQSERAASVELTDRAMLELALQMSMVAPSP